MFGSDKKGASRPPVNVDTLIGSRTVIRGDVGFAGGLHVDGKIVGSVVSEPDVEAMLMLSDKGVIEGEVRAPHVVINGQLKGDIVASERVELAAQARVVGNIYYKLLEMAAGAQVSGQIMREEEPRKQLPKPAEPVEVKDIKDLKEAKEAKRA
jgi:cytoskeletal protein CcmA (bactofilin family)